MEIGRFPFLANSSLHCFEMKQWLAQESRCPYTTSSLTIIFLTITFGEGIPGFIAVKYAYAYFVVPEEGSCSESIRSSGLIGSHIEESLSRLRVSEYLFRRAKTLAGISLSSSPFQVKQ